MSTVDDPWLRDVPAMFRALADPQLLDAMPRPTTGPLEQACGHWGALHYTLTSLLAWSDVGRGLSWWYAEGKPVNGSPILARMRAVWGREDLIDFYAAWAWRSACGIDYPAQHQGASGAPSPTWLATHSLWPDQSWWCNFLRRGQVHRHDPFHGGSDPLHLAAHSGPPSDAPSANPLVQVIPDQRRAVLVTEGLDHWLADLVTLQTRLPSLGDRSWRVDVFDRTVGWLGEFRRSRVTGSWFNGKHSIHLRGVQTPNPH